MATAHAPHSGLAFSFGIDMDSDGLDDCSTLAAIPCDGIYGDPIVVSVYLNSTGLTGGYFSYRSFLEYAGLSSKLRVVQTWPDCASSNVISYAPNVVFTCAAAPSTTSSYTGKLAEVVFTCDNDFAYVRLVHGTTDNRAMLVDGSGVSHAEGQPTEESLGIYCDPSGAINTQQPNPTPQCVPLSGDADNDGDVDAVDGMFVLQYVASLRFSLPCAANADVDDSSTITTIDGSLILQMVAGLA